MPIPLKLSRMSNQIWQQMKVLKVPVPAVRTAAAEQREDSNQGFLQGEKEEVGCYPRCFAVAIWLVSSGLTN